MLSNVRPLKYRVGGVGAVLRSYGFSEGELVPDSLHPLGDDPHLNNCFSICVNQSSLLRTGRIDTYEKLTEFLEACSALQKEMATQKKSPHLPLRISSTHLCQPESEWDHIVTQHALFGSYGQNKLIHINLPTKHIYANKQKRNHLISAQKALEHLYRLQNVIAWITYSHWLNEEMEQHLSVLHPEAIDEYQLEGALKNVSCEMGSLFMQRSTKKEALLAQNLASPSEKDLLKIEKELVAVREDLQADLRTLYSALEKVEVAIEKIEEDHTELIPLKAKTSLLRHLIAGQAEVVGQNAPSWGQQLMMVHLLNDHFDIISAVNCDTGLDRTSVAFSVWLALAELRREYSLNRITDMVLHWDSTTHTLNRVIARDGVAQPFTEQEQAQIKLRSTLVIQLREYFLANMQVFSLPITALSSGSTRFKHPENSQINFDFLNFLPSFGEITTDMDVVEMVKLVNYHPLSGTPLSLTEEGNRFMERLAYLEPA